MNGIHPKAIPLEVLALPVGQMQSNCYVVSDSRSGDALIIDPGDDADYIQRSIADHSFKPIGIVATHGHFDHIMAATELSLAYGIPFRIHANDEFLVANLELSAYHFLKIHTDPPPIVAGHIQEKTPVTVGSYSLEVLETPGHTPGSICLYHKASARLFTGDLLFAGGGVGRTDFSYSNAGLLAKSLTGVFRLPAAVTIYPGHGEPSTLGSEREYHHNILS